MAKRFVGISLSDNRIDLDSGYFSGDPINRLPVKCEECDFPDLDFLPQPYFLLRGASMTPAEISAGAHGNLLVRPRLKRILEVVLPNQCRFFPTTYLKSLEPTPWSVAVPVGFCHTGVVKKTIPRCKSCGEPLSGHPGTEYENWKHVLNDRSRMTSELYKSENWSSGDLRGGARKAWIDREISVSLRFYRLLRELKVAGIYQTGGETKPDKAELAWASEKMALVQEKDIPLVPEGDLSSEDKKWFADYLKANQRVAKKSIDVRDLEKRHKVKFPKSFLDYVETVGCQSFSDIDGKAGFGVTIHLPQDCDFENFRKGVIQSDDEESQAVNGVMFASTDHGDCFVFDVRKDRKEYEVFIYLHELNSYENYAPNFVKCIKRFAAAIEPSRKATKKP